MVNTRLTKPQIQKVGEFLRLFASVESALKKRLNLKGNDRSKLNDMITRYSLLNPWWQDSANLMRKHSEIRNLLTHQSGEKFGYPVALAPFVLEDLRIILEKLEKTEPASVRYAKHVIKVLLDDPIAKVVELAFENGFSQFSVIQGERFVGLITENEITRWLGRQVRAKLSEVNLDAVTVGKVIREKDPTMSGITTFEFSRLDIPVEEVMGRFCSCPSLEVIFLTSSGGRNTPIEGIVTQWDAARFSGLCSFTKP